MTSPVRGSGGLDVIDPTRLHGTHFPCRRRRPVSADIRAEAVFRGAEDWFSYNQMKSASCAEDWSFANSQASWSNGPGKRSCSGGGCAYVARAPVKPPGDGIARVPAAPTCLQLLPAGALTIPARDRPVVGLLLADPAGTTAGRFCMVSSEPLAHLLQFATQSGGNLLIPHKAMPPAAKS